MSSIAITGGATGTGVFSLLAPSTSTNRTLTLPDVTGTLLSTASTTIQQTGVSAINVIRSTGQSLSANTYTKVAFNTEIYDTKSEYDSATNYRFTPTVAGYYLITSQLTADGTLTNMNVYIYKNGARAYDGNNNHSSSYYNSTNISIALYLNGSTDYIEIYAASSAGGAIQGGSTPNVSWFTSNFMGAA